MRTIKISNKKIGPNEPTFIIAEAGSNHNGKLSQAKQLIDIAAEAEVDAIKFQVFRADKHYSKKTPKFSYLKSTKSTYDIIKENELPREWLEELSDYSKEKGLIFMATPSDIEAIDLLESIGVPVYKWASFEIVDLPLLKYAASKKKPIFLSTGLCNLDDIKDALETIYSTKNKDVVLLHCVSLYPTAANQVNLKAMDTMKKEFNVPVGYSDHTLGVMIPIAAVARGAAVIEKHFTISRKLEGPDHKFAIEPDELQMMVKGIREVEVSLGSSIKKMIPEEEEMARLGRRSIIARTNIPKGTIISEDMLIIKRPGFGIKPKFLNKVIGRKAKKDIEAEDVITWELV